MKGSRHTWALLGRMGEWRGRCNAWSGFSRFPLWENNLFFLLFPYFMLFPSLSSFLFFYLAFELFLFPFLSFLLFSGVLSRSKEVLSRNPLDWPPIPLDLYYFTLFVFGRILLHTGMKAKSRSSLRWPCVLGMKGNHELQVARFWSGWSIADRVPLQLGVAVERSGRRRGEQQVVDCIPLSVWTGLGPKRGWNRGGVESLGCHRRW